MTHTPNHLKITEAKSTISAIHYEVTEFASLYDMLYCFDIYFKYPVVARQLNPLYKMTKCVEQNLKTGKTD